MRLPQSTSIDREYKLNLLTLTDTCILYFLAVFSSYAYVMTSKNESYLRIGISKTDNRHHQLIQLLVNLHSHRSTLSSNKSTSGLFKFPDFGFDLLG